MSVISLSDYANIYRDALGGKTIPSNTVTSMVVSRNTGTSVIGSVNYKNNNIITDFVTTLVVPNNNTLVHQTAPTLNIKSINVGNVIAKVYPDTSKFNFSSYDNWKKVYSIIIPFVYQITQLTTDQVTLPSTTNSGSGANDIGITMLSGKYCEIRINTLGSTGIGSIDSLPASLNFNYSTSTITGIPFVTGSSISNIILTNGTKITLTFNIIPISTFSGI